MTFTTPPLVPELDVSDLDRSLAVYLGVFGFECIVGVAVPILLEERWYPQGKTEAGNRQFVVVDGDAYMLRFFKDLGRRRIQKPMDENIARG
jgi:hypothetical protein